MLIPYALQPAQVEEVFLYPRLGRAIVLVKEDQLSLAIGRRGQNVRLASKLVGWDIEIMTHDELNEGIERAEGWFHQVPNVTDEIVEAFIEEGFLSYDDLTFVETYELAELSGTTEEQAQEMIEYAEEASERVEEETRLQKEAEAEARAHAPPPSKPTAAERLAELFPEQPDEAGEADAPKPTVESLFGPETAATAAPEEPGAAAPPEPAAIVEAEPAAVETPPTEPAPTEPAP